MDLLAACEDLAANISAFDFVEDEPHVSDSDSQRWQDLFSLSHDEAVKAIGDWRSDFSRPSISQAAWETVKTEKMAEGYDKEAYEYSIFKESQTQKTNQPSSPNQTAEKDATYLLKLEDHLPSVQVVKRLASLDKTPKLVPGVSDDGSTTDFCLLTASEKAKVIDSLSRINPSWQPTIIRTSIASKDLSPVSMYPTLGIDTTLPQFRPNQSDGSSIQPTQNQYPVWYFFYGTLANPAILTQVLGHGQKADEATCRLFPARVQRGRLSTWGDKYLALVDAEEESVVTGWTYMVNSRDEEESLRIYETGRYEVVRCTIEFWKNGWSVQGLTFRFV